MIAITGASGNLGMATMQFLLQKELRTDIIAIVRNAEKLANSNIRSVQIRQADYNNQKALRDALQNVTNLVQISSSMTGHPGSLHEKNVVLAAKEVGVKHILYTSSLRPKANAHFLAAHQALGTELEIIKSGLAYTFFRNSLYMELIPGIIGNAMETNEIRYPCGNGRVSFVSRIDIAQAIANIITRTNLDNQTYEITGVSAYSIAELANIINAVRRSTLHHIDISENVYREQLSSLQIPSHMMELLTSMANGIRAGEFSYTHTALEKLLGRKPLSLAEYIKSL